MTTLDQWINASIDTARNSVDCLDELKANPDRLLIQARALKQHVDSFVEFLERQDKRRDLDALEKV